MKILVCVKVVPKISKVQLDEHNNLIRDGLKSTINPSDLTALQFALTLKKNYGAEVSVLSMGPPDISKRLKKLYKMGVDKVYALSAYELKGCDSLATSYSLYKAIENLGDFEIIFTGDYSTDGNTSQIAPQLAEFLGYNLITYMKSLKFEEGKVVAIRKLKTSSTKISCKMPVVISCIRNDMISPKADPNAVNPKGEVQSLDFECLNIDLNKIGVVGSPTIVNGIFKVEKKSVGSEASGEDLEEKCDFIAETLIPFLKVRL